MNLASYKKTSTKNKILIKISALFLSALALFYFLISPILNKIVGLKKNIINTEIAIKNSQDQKTNMATLEKKLKNLEPQIEKLNQVFINKNRELEFITSLENIATKNRVLQTMDLKNFPEKNNDFTTISLQVSASGNFNNLMSYLTDIENSPYYINIINISVNEGTGASSEILENLTNKDTSTFLNMNFTADVFFK